MTNSTTFPGTLTCPTSLVSNVMTMGTTKTFVVTMTNASGANKYYIDGYLQASLVLHQGQTYIFDLSSGTLSGHPFEFSTTNNGSHGGGSVYSTGITTTGTYASSEKRTFVVSASTPTTLYYYCTAHSGMGGSVSISSEAELLVSGGAEFIGTGTIKLPSGTTAQRPTTGMTGMIRYNTTTGFIETYTAEGWGSIAPPPVITGISPTSIAGADTATQVFTVTGTGFDTGLTIKLVGADDTEYSVFSTTRVSGQSATFKMGANGATDGYDAAQRPFKVKVTGGDTASAVTSTSVASIALVAPTITGVSPTTFASSAVGSQTITVSGTNFTSSMASGNNIQVLGADGSTLYNVDSAAVASATSITFKLAATSGSLSTGQLDNRPYKVRVTNAIGITATSTATIGFNGIAWSSPASGATLTYDNGVSSSQNLVATDDLGGTDITFSITSGSVAGLSLGSATASPATFSGSGTTDGTTNVTFRVTDNESGTTADRTFSVVVSSALFAFSSHTFTSVGLTGKTGPSINQLRNNYSTVWDGTNAYFNLYGYTGFQLFTIPVTGNYLIDAKGAEGGRNIIGGTGAQTLKSPGQGAHVSARFYLTKGTKIVMIVGQKPTAMTSYTKPYGGGGGGATWVLKPGTFTSSNDVYLVAGAGGGAGTVMDTNGYDGGDANGSSQGTLGSGGASSLCKGAGAGWTSMGGGVDQGDSTLTGGYHPAGGARGGDYDTSNEFGGNETWASAGGFGGGGGNCNYSPGGGAGASGGSHTGTSWVDASVGGTSYIMPNGTGGMTVSSRVFDGNTTSAAGVYIEKLP